MPFSLFNCCMLAVVLTSGIVISNINGFFLKKVNVYGLLIVLEPLFVEIFIVR